MNNEEKILELLEAVLEKQSALEQRQGALESEITNMRGYIVAKIEHEFEPSLKATIEWQVALESEITDMRGYIVAKIEHEFEPSLKATVEWQDMLDKKLDDHTERLDRIEGKVDELNTRTNINEMKIERLAN